MPETPAKPIADGLFTWPSDAPRLIASRCTRCGAVAFPAQQSCPKCTSEAVEETLLSREGELWTWTIQRFPPPHPWVGDPKTFEPFGVGYVELPEGIRVEGILTTADPDALEIGQTMELVTHPYGEAEDGTPLVTFAFAPVAG